MLAPIVLLAVTSEVAKLHAIFDKTWERQLRESPMFATSVGRHEYDDKLPSITPADLARRQSERKATLADLAKVDRAKLPPSERVNYDIFKEDLEEGIESYDFGDYEMPLNADSGFHSGFARLAKEMPLATTKDYENYISRLNAWPRYVREQIANMRLGLKSGMTVPRATLEGVDKTIEVHVRRSDEERFLAALRQISNDGAGGRPGSIAQRRPRRGHERRQRLQGVPRLLPERVCPRRAHHARGIGAAERTRVLPVQDPRIHHSQSHARADSQNRTRRG